MDVAKTVAEDRVGESIEKEEVPCVIQDFARRGDAGNKANGDPVDDKGVNFFVEGGEESDDEKVGLGCLAFNCLECGFVFGFGANGRNGCG